MKYNLIETKGNNIVFNGSYDECKEYDELSKDNLGGNVNTKIHLDIKSLSTYNYYYGVFLGYPRCCIEYFGDVAIPLSFKHSLSREYAFNGFVPCPDCASKLKSHKVTYDELINKDRFCRHKFRTHAQSIIESERVSQELTIFQKFLDKNKTEMILKYLNINQD